MGTSTSYTGPTRSNPLLPPWALDPLMPLPVPSNDMHIPDDDQGLLPVAPADNIVTPWRVPKGALSRRARGNTKISLGSVCRGYVRASGGARQATATARSGRAASARFGRFLSNGLQNGLAQTLHQFGLQEFIGRDASFVLAALVDLLAPAGAIREEAVARQAMIDTLSDWFDQVDVATNGFDALDGLTPESVAELMRLSVANYVNARFQQELVSRIDGGTLSEREANQLAGEVKEFIAGVIRLDFKGVDLVRVDWEGAEGHSLVANIYEAAYSLLGDAP